MTSNDNAGTKLSPAAASALLLVIALAWGMSWPVNKAVLAYVSPLWAVVTRLWVATAVLAAIYLLLGRMRLPPRQDLPMVVSLAVLHMSLFAGLTSLGLVYVSAGRTVLLAYTTPLWVFPLAWLFMGEALTAQRLIAIASGILGLLLLINPLAIAWGDQGVLLGHALILLAAICWAFSIVYTRRHTWASSPFDLLLWQLLLAAVLTTAAAFLFEGWPVIRVTPHFLLLLVYGGTISTSLAYWALNTVNRSLPATSTALGLLAVPLFGVVSSIVTLGETFDALTLAALLLIVGGIAIGTIGAQPENPRGHGRARPKRAPHA
jgi:drug/metabolite transporter (DMT)-like permease